MVKIREVIVVEGKYDQNTLSQLVDATILQTRGFGIFKDRQMREYLRQTARKRGIIVLTDSDGAGFVIRNHLRGILPAEQVKHAYIPDVYGKERRKASPGKEGKLGVEGMRPEVLLEALKNAGATIEGETTEPRGEITKLHLFDRGLTGGRESRERREKLLQMLHLPQHMSTNALLQALNVLMSYQEFCTVMDELERNLEKEND